MPNFKLGTYYPCSRAVITPQVAVTRNRLFRNNFGKSKTRSRQKFEQRRWQSWEAVQETRAKKLAENKLFFVLIGADVLLGRQSLI